MLTSHNTTHIHECLLAIITHIYLNVNFPDYSHNTTHIHECLLAIVTHIYMNVN
jgi:hypothetical protein